MQKLKFNTDMADERVDEYKEINNMSDIDGIEILEEKYDEFKITQVNVTNENGSRAIEKEIGTYVTFEMEDVKYIDDREKIIMKLRYGFDGRDELTQKEVADKLGISQSYISRLEKKVINDLKKYFTA